MIVPKRMQKYGKGSEVGGAAEKITDDSKQLRKYVNARKTMSYVISRAKLGKDPLETNGDVRKLKLQCNVRNIPRDELPTMVGDAVWNKVTREHTETR